MNCLDPNEDWEHAFVGELTIHGQWQHLDPDTSIVLTWTWCRDINILWNPDIPRLVTRVLIDLTSTGPNTTTTVQVRHEGFPAQLYNDVQTFWTWQLDRLRAEL